MSEDSKKSLDNIKEARGYSHSEKHSITYTWEINEITSFINYARDTKAIIESPTFSTGPKKRDSWKLQLVVKKDKERALHLSVISIYLFSINENQKARTDFSFFFLNNKKEKIGYNMNDYSPSQAWYHQFFENSEGIGYPQFIAIDDLLEIKDEYLQNDTLTVGVDLIVHDDYVAINSTIDSLESPEQTLANDFKDLFVSKNKSDVVIIVGDEKFQAHKLILVARSCVFDAMFSHNMKENKENEVNIPDIDPKVFKQLLEFIYTDKVEELESFGEELLEASDKYQIQGLKEICENSLSKSLTFESAIRILILADRHNAKRLKEFVINYVVIHLINFKKTEEYKALEVTQPLLLLAVLIKYAEEIEIK